MKRETFDTTQRSRPNISALTGLRFFAAFFILFAHAVDWLAQFQDSRFRENFTFVSMYGMPLFFVLSGFVIHYNYGMLFSTKPSARAVAEFGAARFARLFPLYFCFLLMAIVADDFVLKTFNRPELAAEILAFFFTLTQTWLFRIYDGISVHAWLFGLSWSISTEMFFYLAYVPAVYFVLRIKKTGSALAAVLLYAFGVTLLFIWSRYELVPILNFFKAHVALTYVGAAADFEQSAFRWIFYYSPYTRVFEFLMGCLTAHLFITLHPRPVSKREQSVATAALVAALSLLVILGMLYQGAIKLGVINVYVQHLALNFLCAPAIAVVLLFVCRYDGAFTRFMSLPLLVALGETSYSIYLVHTWTLRIFNHPITGYHWALGIEAVFRVAFGIIFTLLVAYATYQLIEVPSRVWLRRRLGRVIAIGFGDAAGSSRSLPEGPSTLRARLAILAVAISLLALVVAARRTDAVWQRVYQLWYGNGPKIFVASATYGLNCKSFAVPAPFPNRALPGNATEVVERACNLLQQCNFRVDASRLGDPANSCGKDFSVEYRCTGSDTIKSASLPPEADGKSVILDCGIIK